MADPHQGSLIRHLEVEEPIAVISRIPSAVDKNPMASAKGRFGGFAKHTLGLLLLLAVVFLWTASNFLGSSIFADNTYAKPFFLTYLNTSCFILAAVPVIIRSGYQRYQEGNLYATIRKGLSRRNLADLYRDETESEAFLKPDGEDTPPVRPSTARLLSSPPSDRKRTHLGFKPTARLSFTFCILWFSANYFAMSCLQYTAVASATILTSTSSIWTLLIGALTHTERFTWRKLCGVLGSLIGIIIISSKDLSSKDSPPNQNTNTVRAVESFPDKKPAELAFGDFLALLSAMIYGLYTITLKQTTLKAAPLQLNMPLFFGLVGFFNAVLLFPLFPILSWTGVEQFELPPTSRIWTILLINSVSSLLSDICWAYAMVLTSPLIVTVGLSLTIPLSLVGEMIIQGRTEGLIYWVGAFIVVFSFVFVDREESRDDVPVSELVVDESENNDNLEHIDDLLRDRPSDRIT